MNADAKTRSFALPEQGDVIADKYRIESLIAQGGMGAVFRATHTVSGKPVALKWILPERSGTQAEQRMVREAQATARIDHPNVVDVYDVGSDGASVFLVMELLRGETLAARLLRGRLSPQEAIELLMPAMRGVAAAHAQGVVHRDLKPENILLCCGPDGSPREPKVLDFGISKFSDGTESGKPGLTQSRTILGTPYYMSPEQANGSSALDHRADIYAFGVILYELVTEALPFDAETYNALIVKIATTYPQHLSVLRPDLPPVLVDVVMRALDKDPETRFQTVEDFALALEPFGAGVRFVPPRGSGLFGNAEPPAASERASVPLAQDEVYSPTLRDDRDSASRAANVSAPPVVVGEAGAEASRSRSASISGQTLIGPGPSSGPAPVGSTAAAERAQAAAAAAGATHGRADRAGRARIAIGAAIALALGLAATGWWWSGREAGQPRIVAPAPPVRPGTPPDATPADAADATTVPVVAAGAAPVPVGAEALPAGALPPVDGADDGAASEASAAVAGEPASPTNETNETSETDQASQANQADQMDEVARAARARAARRARRRRAKRVAEAVPVADVADVAGASAPPRKLPADWDERLGADAKPAGAPPSASGRISLDDL